MPNNSLPLSTRVLIVGLGLMGGSYARALTAKGYRVTAITKDEADVTYALENGIVAEATTAVEPRLIAEADLVVFALYPHILTNWITEHQHLFSPHTIITDVTGVKTSVVSAVQETLRPDVEFIASHPMAGRELSGVRNSTAAIFSNANYIVTPTAQNTPHAIALCESLGHTLGFARVSRLTPEEHDNAIAFLSQLTHCIAVALMTCNDTAGLEAYTGDSFRDLTRIARINDEMWSELFLLNKEHLLSHMDKFAAEFQALRRFIAEDDQEALRAMMRLSTERRDRF